MNKVGVDTKSVYTQNRTHLRGNNMPMSKKQLTKKAQQDKAEAAELQKKAESGDSEAKRKLEKLEKKMKKKK